MQCQQVPSLQIWQLNCIFDLLFHFTQFELEQLLSFLIFSFLLRDFLSQYNYWTFNYLHMATNFLFSCCNNPVKEDSSDSTRNSAPRNIIGKNKTCITLNSPKASLKSLATLRSPKNNNALNSSTNFHMVSTTEFVPLERSNHVNIPHMVPDRITKISRLNINSGMGPVLSPPQILIAAVRSPKQNINFTYKVPTNPQQRVIAKRIPEKQIENGRQIMKIDNMIRFNESNKNEEIHRQNIIDYIPKKVQEIVEDNKQQKIQNQEIKNTNKFKLGGSKFTIMSQGEMESLMQQKSMRMQESAIVVNLFHPTQSLMKKWQQSKIKLKGSAFSFSKKQQNQGN